MRIRRTAFTSLITLLMLAGPILGLAQAEVEADGVCGLYPVEEQAYLATELTLAPGQGLSSLQWFNNDGQQPFTALLLLEGVPGQPPDLTGGALVLHEVWGLSSEWSEVQLETPVSSSTGTIHAVFVLPDGGYHTSEGAFGGPGVGYSQGSAGRPAYASLDGLEWERFHESYQLSVDPVLAAGKKAALQLAGLSPYLESPEGTDGNAGERQEAPRNALLAPRPNPFNPTTEIRYSLSRPGRVRLVIYDVQGRRIRELLNEERPVGLQSTTWYGRDDRGQSVASGVYHLRMEVAGETFNQRLTLLK